MLPARRGCLLIGQADVLQDGLEKLLRPRL